MPRMTPDEERDLVERIERGDEDPTPGRSFLL
jgi:hypothetical protein